MEDLTPIRTEWRKAKARAAACCIAAGLEDVAQKLRVCTMFHGDETLEELVEKLFSPQGVEFISRFDFPTVDIFRQFKKYDDELRQMGVFIDCGEITLYDVPRVMLIGNTSGRLKYARTQGNTVCVLCGATAHIEAVGYSVVSVNIDKHSKSRSVITNHAIVR